MQQKCATQRELYIFITAGYEKNILYTKAGTVNISVTRKMPRANLSFFELTAIVKAITFANKAKLIAAVSKFGVCTITCKKYPNGFALAFQK